MLNIYDCCDKDGHVWKFISFAQAIPYSSSDDDDTDITPNSGTTSTMWRRQSNFEDDYQTCTDVSILISNASQIPIVGYGMSWMWWNSYPGTQSIQDWAGLNASSIQ